MTRDDLLSSLQRLGACSDSLSWVRSQDGSAYDLWRRCDRGDWLLWLAARAGVDRQRVVLAACDCAEPALAHVPVGEERPRVAIEAARRWAHGDATIGEVRAAARAAAYAADAAAHAADAAYSAADAHAADAAYSAYTAAADVARAAYAAARAAAHAAAAYAAAHAAYAAAHAAYAAADAGARARSLAESARLVRRRIPWSVVRDALSGGES